MLIFAKIHKAEFIEDMYEKEYLYFNSLKSFRSKPSDKTGRLDPRELNLKNQQLTTLTIKLPEREIPLHKIAKKFSAQYMEHLSDPKINCCSLHWIEIEPDFPQTTYNSRLLELGDKTMLIYDWKAFLDILDQSIEENGLTFSRKKVEYYNPKIHNGDISLHHKDELYSWQNEYRILIAPTDNKPIKLTLKGLKKISCIIDTKYLNTLRVEIQ